MGASIGLTVGVDGTGEYVKSLKNITAETKAFQSELKALDSSFDKNTSTWDKSKLKASVLSDEIRAQNQKLAALAETQGKFAEGSTEWWNYADKINKATDALNKMEEELRNLPNHIQAIGKDLEEWGGKIKGAGNEIKLVGDTLMPLSAAAGAGLGAAVKTTADFEKAMSEAWAVSGALDSSLTDLQKQEAFSVLEAKAREMGRTTKFTATEAAEAIKYMGLAGWETSGIIAGLPGVINLAASADMDLATASDIVTDTLTAYGDAQEEATRYADVFAATMANSNTTVELMGESLKYIGPVAGAMGYEFEDTALAIGLMGNAAIKGSTAGTTLRNLLTNMAKPTKEMEDAMKTLGVTLDDGQGNMYSLYDVLLQLRDGFGTLKIPAEELTSQMKDLEQQLDNGQITEDEYAEAVEKLAESAYGAEGALKAKEAAALGGKRAMAGLLAIVSASDEDFDSLSQAIYGSAGAAEAMRDVMMDNLAGDLTILKSELSELAIQFGEIMIPVLRDLVGVAHTVIDGLSGMDEGTRSMIIKAGLFIAAVGPVLSIGGRLIGGIGTLVSSGGKLLQLVGGIVGGASSAASAAGSVATAAGGLTGAITGGGGLIAGLGSLVSAAAPFLLGGVVIAGIGAAAVFVITHWDSIKEKAGELGAFVGQKWEELKENTSKAFESIKNKVDVVWGDIKTATSASWDKIKETTSHAWSAVKKTWDDSTSEIYKAYDKHGGGVIGLAAAAMEGIHQAHTAGFNLLNNLTNGKLNDIKGLWDGTFHTLVGNALTWGSDLVHNLGEGISSAWGWVKEKVSGIAQGIKDFLGFSEPSDGPLSDFHTYGPDMMELYASGIASNEGLVTNTLRSIGANISGIFGGIKSDGWNGGVGLSENFGGGLESAMSRATSAAEMMKSRVMSALSGIASSAHSWGSDLANGMARGIESAMGRAASAAASLAENLSSYLHFSEPDVGPLSNFHTWMPDMMKQLASGIYNNMGQVDKAINTLANRMVLTTPEVTLPDRSTTSATITNGDTVINVYGTQNQDVNQLADIVMRKLTIQAQRQMYSYG